LFSFQHKKAVKKGDFVALTRNIGLELENKPSALSEGVQNRLLRSSYSVRGGARERRRNNMGFGSFKQAKQEIAVESPSALQVMCKKKKAKNAKKKH